MQFGWIFKQYHKKVMPNLFPSSLAQFCRGYGPLIHELVCKTICNVRSTVQMCKKQANPMQKIICKVAPLFFQSRHSASACELPLLAIWDTVSCPLLFMTFRQQILHDLPLILYLQGKADIFHVCNQRQPNRCKSKTNFPNNQSNSLHCYTQCCGSGIWDPVPFWPLDQGFGIRKWFFRIPDLGS